jgi:nickel transport protein
MRLRRFLNIKFVCILIALATPGIVLAHGTGYRVLDPGKAVTIECYYSDGTAMAYGDTIIFSPEDLKLEHQNGRTDKNGRVAFFPDTPGTWRVNVSDGMGHKIQAQVQVEPGKNPSSKIQDPVSTGHSRALLAVMGISLIFNLCAGIVLVRRKKC